RFDLLFDLLGIATEDRADRLADRGASQVGGLGADRHAGFGDADDLSAVFEQHGALPGRGLDRLAVDDEFALRRDFRAGAAIVGIAAVVLAVDTDVDAVTADRDIAFMQLLAGLFDLLLDRAGDQALGFLGLFRGLPDVGILLAAGAGKREG